MRAFGFRAMDWNIGFNDGVNGRKYNSNANSDLYDAGFRRGRRQRMLEAAMSAIVMGGLGAIGGLQALFWMVGR